MGEEQEGRKEGRNEREGGAYWRVGVGGTYEVVGRVLFDGRCKGLPGCGG